MIFIFARALRQVIMKTIESPWKNVRFESNSIIVSVHMSLFADWQ